MPPRLNIETDRIVALYQEGLTFVQVAARLGVSRSMIQDRLRQAGVERRPQGRTPADFWSKVNRNGPLPDERPELGPCWVWTGAHDRLGYGRDGRQHTGSSRLAHVIAYESLHGPVPSGLELDHLCRRPACVRPSHLEPVSHRENCIIRGRGPFAQRAAQTHCIRGHVLSDDNVYVYRNGTRMCRTCHREREASRRRGELYENARG